MGHHAIFDAATLCGIPLSSRIVMSPMTRSFSPGGIPGENVAQYYARRATGGAGLIITEGTWIPHSSASNDPNAPRFYGEDALAGWLRVVEAVHAAGGRIIPQLWHAGLIENPRVGMSSQSPVIEAHQRGPSGLGGGAGKMPVQVQEPMTVLEIEEIITAYAEAAASAQSLGFDGIELHGAHGYLIDQFLWESTNLRSDRYGGGLGTRSHFGAEIVRACRARVGDAFPIFMRISQWKLHDFNAKLATTPEEFDALLSPLAEAGVDVFHCSQRRFFDPEFDGSSLNLAGWVRKLTGKPTITVGSVGLDAELQTVGVDDVASMFDRGECDLIAVGRAILADPEWPLKMRSGRLDEIKTFDRGSLGTLF